MTTPPTQPGTCGHCGHHGEVFLAWDRRRWLCKNAGRCLGRANRNNQQEKEQ